MMSSEKEPSRGQTDATKSHQAIDTSKHEQDDDDLFREVYTLEDQLLSKGLQEGHEAGRQLGWLEGRDLGYVDDCSTMFMHRQSLLYR